jgi:hypothetical protein
MYVVVALSGNIRRKYAECQELTPWTTGVKAAWAITNKKICGRMGVGHNRE